MVLNINMEYDEMVPVRFEVTFSGMTKVISGETKSVSFCFEKEDTYEIKIAQKEVDETFSTLQKLMFILFLPIIGLFSGLSVYGETKLVFRKINPYLISQKIVLRMESDTQIDVAYIVPEYDKRLMTWTKPSLLFSNLKNTDSYTITNNIKNFFNCYLGFKRSFIAICFDVIAFFMVVAFLALHKNDEQVFITFLLLSLSLLFLCILTLILVKKKNYKNEKIVCSM